MESDAPDSKTTLPWSSLFRRVQGRIRLRRPDGKPIQGWNGGTSDAPFIGVDAVEKRLNVVPLQHAHLFFTELKPGLDCGVRVASRLRQCDIERCPFRRPLRAYIQADPVAHLTIGGTVANHLNEGLGCHTGGGQPPGIEAFVKEVFLVVGMQLSAEMKAYFVNEPGKINPPGHHLPGGSRENACAHKGEDAPGSTRWPVSP